MNLIDDFLKKVRATYKTGVATEHSYRSAIETLFSGLSSDISALNEPKRVACGAPDFIVQRGELVIGHIEAKDIGVDLRKMNDANKKQQERYRHALPNLIYTNCLDWDFYRDGELIASVTIADYLLGIKPNPENYSKLLNLLQDFIAQQPQTITKPEILAKMMAGKAILIKDVLQRALSDSLSQVGKVEPNDTDGIDLVAQYNAFKDQLIHDISPEDFADIYAETMAYGMFAARLHDDTLATFSRQEALTLLPKSNPFLRGLFAFLAGNDLDERLVWIIDDLAMVFQAADVAKIMEGFGKLTGRNDPFLHFYETFLAAYNPAKRKARGVWYTPEPVVNFIVRAVDEVLQKEFNLSDGLADTSKITIDWETGQNDKKGKPIISKKEVHRVQILDPATGTGTFLAEVIKQIAPKIHNIAPAMWSSYIEEHLIPRLHGFELLMASYAMCHLKLDMILSELGYKPTKTPPRLSVYLTNSLEEGAAANYTLPFAQWLSNEAKYANTIKRDMPIMCILGNPPYAGHSSNKNNWIENLVADYKKSPELKKPAQSKWLSDDYVKFFRLSEYLIEKNNNGVVAFITNHGYLDNPTFKDMRKHILSIFDKVYIVNLHGNSKRKEKSPDGSPDKNVFDIQQGVAIFIGIRKAGGRNENTKVFYIDIFGERAKKYKWLDENYLNTINFIELTPTFPSLSFVPMNQSMLDSYMSGVSIPDLFSPNGRAAPGIVTTQDQFAISWTQDDVKEKIKLLLSSDDEEAIRKKFKLCTQAQWNYEKAKQELHSGRWVDNIDPIYYRPFDCRFTVYDSNVSVHLRHRVMSHMRRKYNIGLCFNRSVEEDRPFTDIFVFDGLIQHHSLSIKEVNYISPLYLYPDSTSLLNQEERQVNFDPGIYQRLQELGQDSVHGKPNELDVFDYVYGVLHCPSYRTTYAEFLKIDFPRIPWPRSPEEFWYLSQQGSTLRKLHLMDKATIGTTPYPLCAKDPAATPSNQVEKPTYKDGKIWINAHQYFDNAPESAWELYIGGYQPAQKWLKDRKERVLSFSDVQHYQRILKILAETKRLMEEMKIEY